MKNKGLYLLLESIVWILISCSSLFSQSRTASYTIRQKGSPIGNIRFTESNSTDKRILRLESSIEPKSILNLDIRATEETIFENEVLTHSSVYRCVNDKEKLNSITRLTKDGYQVHTGENVEIVQSAPIRYNMICLYAIEPHNISSVYSDIFQKFLEIERIGHQQYKIRFPDGNFNEYFYQNGICEKIVVHSILYNATIEFDDTVE